MSSNSSLRPITLYGQSGANPPKVLILLRELNLPHTVIPIPFSDVKKSSYTAINPNGRLPAIHDPNTNLTLWESGAIVEYLIEQYDKEPRKLSFEPGSNDAFLAKQWLFFQVSGQGPYYGQAGWFLLFHHEKLPSALQRYVDEVHRVMGVLEGWLGKQKEEYEGKGGLGDGPWLVGNRISYADLAFLPWQVVIEMVLGDKFNDEGFPLVREWLGKMLERDAVKPVVELMKKKD